MSVTEVIQLANALLPGEAAPEGQPDPRWKAIIEVGNHIESSPEEVWRFARKWGNCPQEDVRDAIACCLLEHLLEYHFALMFSRVEQAVTEDDLFADTFGRCWKFGQSDAAGNSDEFSRLQAWCKTRSRPPKVFPVRIGVDFDNTVVCYDELFRKVSLERGLVPPDIPALKGAVRDHLRQTGREDLWTELQGCVYGARMPEARPFPGAIEFLLHCRRAGVPLWIISHRTRHPYLGQPCDLHQAARNWMDLYGFGDPGRIGLAPDHVCLELTKQDKLARITEVGCTHFIDDLPEFLEEAAFPRGVEKILFDPGGLYPTFAAARPLASWEAIERLLLPKEA
jgi:hypothetical protein